MSNYLTNEYFLIIIEYMEYVKYKKHLQKILDLSLKYKTEDTFGVGSLIKISNVSYVRSSDSYIINTTLYITDIENSMMLYPDGLNLIVKAGWDVLGSGKPIIIQSSLDVQ